MATWLETVLRSLTDGGCRYLVAGGVAVVLHGHARFTADLDLFVDLDPANAARAVRILDGLGYRPRPPVKLADFADGAARTAWAQEKGLRVLSLWSPDHPLEEIDLFVEAPLPFEEAWARRADLRLEAGEAHVLGLADLVALKRAAGRAQDLDDVEHLLLIAESAHEPEKA